MKKILSFSAPTTKEYKLTKKDFREVEGGYEVDQVIFSTAYNRNKYFFQVSQLMAYADKLTKLGSNLNHDLRLTNNQYVPAMKAGYTKIWYEWVNGDLEIRGTFRFSDPQFIAVMDQMTGPSIELMVDETHAIINENGEYYPEVEWVGTSQLLGVLAGSGDARNLSEFREFDLNLNPIITMTEEQVKQLLDEQAKTFNAELEAVREELKSFQTVEPTETVEEAPAVETTEEVVETVEETTTEEVKVEEPAQEETPVVDEATETLKTVENALEESIETKSKVFASVQSSESLVDQDDAAGDVKVNSMSIRDQVREKLSHINL